LFDPAQVEPVTPVPTVADDQDNTNTVIGPNFWPLTKIWDSLGATWIPQISLATNNLTQVALLAQAAVNGIGFDKIEVIELGNEPQFYPLAQLGPPNWVGTLNNTA
jgi:hypothetical protein